MRTGRGPITLSNRWPKLCAGSVDTSNTLAPSLARARAVDAEMVVLPTPPLPPKKRIFFDRARSNNNLYGPEVSVPFPCEYAIHGSGRRQRATIPAYRKRQD